MNKLRLSLALLFIMSVAASSQWTANYPNVNADDNIINAKGSALCVDNSGNCYVTGYKAGLGTGNDIMTVKYGSGGDTLWTKVFNGGSNSDDQGFGIAVDNSGNVYVTGTTSNTGSSFDVVLLKYNSSGAFQWVRNYAGSDRGGEDKGKALVIDNNGFIYVVGYCTDDYGVLNMLTLKFDSNGNILWSNKEKGQEKSESRGFGIAVDHLGRVDVTGYTSSKTGKNDVLLVQYSSGGTKNWLRTYNNPDVNCDERAFGIAVDESDNIVITGYTVTIASTGYADCLTLKYNSSGTLQWVRTYNGGANKDDRAFGIAVDSDGSIYITGYATGLTSRSDYVTIKYTPLGIQDWVSLYNGPGNGDDKANAITIIRKSNGKTSGIAVTGASTGNSNDYDYATVRYSYKNGNQQQVSRYSYSGNSSDVAMSVAAYDNDIYVTGYSQLRSVSDDGSEQSVVSTIMLSKQESGKPNADDNSPGKFSLHQNYPNPFNPSTTIKFDLDKNSFVKLVVYDIMGRVVTTLINQNMDAGTFSTTFTAANIASGMYLYKLTAGEYTDVKVMSLVK